MDGDHQVHLLAGEEGDEGEVDDDEPPADDEVPEEVAAPVEVPEQAVRRSGQRDIATLERVVALRLVYGRGPPVKKLAARAPDDTAGSTNRPVATRSQSVITTAAIIISVTHKSRIHRKPQENVCFWARRGSTMENHKHFPMAQTGVLGPPRPPLAPRMTADYRFSRAGN